MAYPTTEPTIYSIAGSSEERDKVLFDRITDLAKLIPHTQTVVLAAAGTTTITPGWPGTPTNVVLTPTCATGHNLIMVTSMVVTILTATGIQIKHYTGAAAGSCQATIFYS